jgi:2-deoxy-D-gluconate 3-dehydrogenase
VSVEHRSPTRMLDLLDLTHRVALITGGNGGLGLAIAHRLGELGAAVVVNGRDATKTAAAVDQLTTAGWRAASSIGDISQRSDVERLLETALNLFGRVDILVNNAAVFPFVPFLDAPEDHWTEVFLVNAVGTMLCSQVVARRLIDQGEGGKIINVLSQGALRPGADGRAAYSASKAAMLMFTQVLAKALATYRIQVNALLPGAMETPGARGVLPDVARIPLGRPSHPDEVARGAVFLATDCSDYMTGAGLLIDGGMALCDGPSIPVYA